MIRLFKPPGWTSHDAVRAVRRCLGANKAGHTGTLDPGAAGVLLVLLNEATRVQHYMVGFPKRYVAELTLGVGTDTGDGFGEVIEVDDVPPGEPGRLLAAAPGFRGDITQVPPMTSSIKHRGVSLHRLARRGISVERKPRRVHISRLELLDWRGGQAPRALFDIWCSSGTYIRSLLSDLAAAAGTCGYMSLLVRVAVGPFEMSSSVLLEEVGPGSVSSLRETLSFMPEIALTSEDSRLVHHGARPREAVAGDLQAGDRVRLVHEGHLLAVGRVDETGEGRRITPERVLARQG